jgi:2-keto-4-pentenoate hydratase/2-oxohepta-3-ene-1,7-dioic acid hydratase in catechol pathway
MALTLLRFLAPRHDTPQWGVQFGERIAPIDTTAQTTGELLSNDWERILTTHSESASLKRSQITLLSPITTNQQFICQGVNYRSHVEESGLRVENFPFNTIFTKASSCITSADAAVTRPASVQLLDYEVELGLVLRQRIPAGTRVDEFSLGRWLAGAVIVNDLSARDIQLPQGQFYKGKSFRGFGPVGPGLVLLTPEEWSRWPEFRLRLSVNGQLRQEAYAGEMIHRPAATLTELAGLQDLQAGDLIATGTPAGCAARAPGRLAMFVLRHLLSEASKWEMFIRKGKANAAYLRPGDVIKASIRTDDGRIDLGEQCTRIVAP